MATFIANFWQLTVVPSEISRSKLYRQISKIFLFSQHVKCLTSKINTFWNNTKIVIFTSLHNCQLLILYGILHIIACLYYPLKFSKHIIKAAVFPFSTVSKISKFFTNFWQLTVTSLKSFSLNYTEKHHFLFFRHVKCQISKISSSWNNKKNSIFCQVSNNCQLCNFIWNTLCSIARLDYPLKLQEHIINAAILRFSTVSKIPTFFRIFDSWQLHL